MSGSTKSANICLDHEGITASMKPNVFSVGFPKSGTTSIYNSLATHPQVLAPRRKEPGDWQHLAHFAGEGAKDYLALYASDTAFPVVIDGTTRYSLNPVAAEAIKSFSPDAKIIIGIREPLSYLYSMAFQIEKNTGVARDLVADLASDETKRWTHIHYAETIRSFFEAFGRENVLVFTYDELRSSQKELLQRIVLFLGLDAEHSMNKVVSNVSKRHKTGLHGALYRSLVLSDTSIKLRAKLKKSEFLKEKVFPALRTRMEKATFETGGVRKKLPTDLEESYRESYREEVAELSELLDVNLVTLWSTEDFSYAAEASS